MKYLLMIFGNQRVYDELSSWPADDVRAMVDHMHVINRDLAESGELVDAQGLAAPREGKTVRAVSGGTPAVTEGPNGDAARVLAGYWLIDVKSEERAIEIAARASAAPGRGGSPSNEPVEVRPIGQAPDPGNG